jgi:hypothetical protein
MRHWPALIIAPLLALADQSVTYAMAGWGCAHQQRIPMDVVHALFLAAAVACTLMAFAASRQALREYRSERFSVQRDGFFGISGTMVGALSSAIIVAMWIPQWFLSPCYG